MLARRVLRACEHPYLLLKTSCDPVLGFASPRTPLTHGGGGRFAPRTLRADPSALARDNGDELAIRLCHCSGYGVLRLATLKLGRRLADNVRLLYSVSTNIYRYT